MAGFCTLAVGLQALNLATSRAKAPIVSAGYLKYSRFWETTTGDRVRSALREAPTAWISAKAKLEHEWNLFETGVRKYVESFGKQIEDQQATFTLQAAAQLKAWREAADKLGNDAKQFAAERRAEIDAAVSRMSVDAAAAEEKLEKLNQAGIQSWSSLMAALTETRAAFDRANQAAREAFKRAA
jgi:hypothetical protein